MQTIFKVFIEFVTPLLLLFMFWFSDSETYGILAPHSGIEPTPPALESQVLATGPPGKSLSIILEGNVFYSQCYRKLPHEEIRTTESLVGLLWTKLGSVCPHTIKSIYWYQLVEKEGAVFAAGAKQGAQAASAQKTQTPQWLSGEGFERPGKGSGVVGCVLSSWTIFWLIGDESGVNIISFLVPTCLGSPRLWAAYS